MTFTEAREKLGNRDSKKVANNTYLIIIEDAKGNKGIGLRLHNTVVVKFFEDRTEVYTGGWETVTTKDRINSFLPVGRINQKDHVWYWSDAEGSEFAEGDQIVQLAGDYRWVVCTASGLVKGSLTK